jgi:peptidoglycan/LPS O-acetylase OafA/YrhL
MGLVLADMHAHGHLHQIRTKWPMWQRLALHAVLIIVACVVQFVPIIRDNVNSGLATINVQAHRELTFSDSIFAICWLFAIETSGLAQNILGNIVMRTLGKASAGLYLLAPAITFTIVPDLALSLHNNGSTASTVLGLSWLVLFAVTLGLAIAFHFVVELPSKMMGEVVAELLEGDGGMGIGGGNGGAGAKEGGGGGKLFTKNAGGGAKPAATKPVLV